MVEAATDNLNRTYPEVRLAFTKHGGNIAEKGAVAFQFDRKGMIRVKGHGDDLLLAALGACTSMTLRLYAERKGWPLTRTRVAVRHDKITGQSPPDTFARQIGLEGPLDAKQTARLFEIADKCPVHRTLEGGSRITTEPFPVPPPAVDERAVAAEADEHFRDMDAECRKAGAP